MEGPYLRPAQMLRMVRAPHWPGQGGCANTTAAGVHTHTTGTRRRAEGQLDRARGTHRPHGMAYQQAKERDTRMGQPVTHTLRGARGEKETKKGGGRRTGGGRPFQICRERRAHKSRVLHPQRQ